LDLSNEVPQRAESTTCGAIIQVVVIAAIEARWSTFPDLVLGDLPFELDAMGAVLGHGFHLLKSPASWRAETPGDLLRRECSFGAVHGVHS
jgi:hypothetical protein